MRESEYDESEEDDDDDDIIPEFEFRDLHKDSDRKIVRESIFEKYGFEPTDDYIEDLIIFVSQMLHQRDDGSSL